MTQLIDERSCASKFRLAKCSLRGNSLHTSTLRLLAIAQGANRRNCGSTQNRSAAVAVCAYAYGERLWKPCAGWRFGNWNAMGDGAAHGGTVVPTSPPAKVTDFPHLILSTARPQRDRLHPVDGRGASKQIIT